MKISARLLQSISAGVTVAVVAVGCHKNDVNSSSHHEEKNKEKVREKENRQNNQNQNIDYCPPCGRG